MDQYPEEEKKDEFINASAEEWSKPSEPEPRPEPKPQPTDRWGSPLLQEETANIEKDWGSEPINTSSPSFAPPEKKKLSKWWIVAIIVVALGCLCLCAAVVGVSYFGVDLFNNMNMGF
jgi:hypothetical protein